MNSTTRKLLLALIHSANLIVGVFAVVKANQLELGWVFRWPGAAVMGYAFVCGVALLKPERESITHPAPTAPPTPEPSIPTDYGSGYKARELANGGWVLWCEKASGACDLKALGYTWRPGDRYFTDCIGSRKKIDSLAKEVMAARGVFKS